jgi:bacillopeptidase F (M6 metalloprotease family)
MLRLPYNIDISDSFDPDVSLVEYIGRKRPVSYYGTQIRESSSWSTEIPKTDTETLFAIRRLAVWMGNAYVREPSGTGYWAHVNVSYSKSYSNLIIPVSFEITRVEGGM